MGYLCCSASEYHRSERNTGFESTWEADCGNRFFKTIASFAYNIPVVGPYLARGLQVAGDKAGANERAHKDLPV